MKYFLNEEDKRAQYNIKLHELNKNKLSKASANANSDSPTSPTRKKTGKELYKHNKNLKNVEKYSHKDLMIREIEN